MTNLKNNTRMNKIKSLYEAPTTNILVVQFEEGVLTGSNKYGAKGAAGNVIEDGYEYEL